MGINSSFIDSTKISEIADVTITMLQERPRVGVLLSGLEDFKGKVYGYYNASTGTVELYILDPFTGTKFFRA